MATLDDAGGLGAGPALPVLPEDWDRCLAVAAHPDDIEYGTASAVARWTARGKQITYLLASRGEAGIDGLHPDEAGPLREAEERAGAREVGVDAVEFLDHRDGAIEYGPDLRRDIVRAIRRHRPEVLVTGACTVRMVAGVVNQADHRVVGLAASTRRGTRATGGSSPNSPTRASTPGAGSASCASPAPSGPPTAWTCPANRWSAASPPSPPTPSTPRGLGAQGFEPRLFLTRAARRAGSALGVEAAVLFDVYQLAFEGPPPWEQ